MKFSFSRYKLALALSAGLLLAACGGGKATFDIKGEVQGVQYTGLVLTNVKNGDTLAVPVGAAGGVASTLNANAALAADTLPAPSVAVDVML